MKSAVRLYNIIISLVCAVAIFFYVTQPFLSVKLVYGITEEQLGNFVHTGGESDGEDKAFDINFNSVLKDASNGKDKLELEVGVSITPKMLLKSNFVKDADKEKFVKEEIIGENIRNVAKELEKVLDSVVESVMKDVTKDSFYKKLGVTSDPDGEIGKAVDTVFEKYKEGQPAGDFADTLVVEINRLKATGNYPNMQEFNEQTLKEDVLEILENMSLVDENGNIGDISDALEKFLNLEEEATIKIDEAVEKSSTTNTSYSVKSGLYAENNQEETKQENKEFTDELVDVILDKIGLGEQGADIIVKGCRFISYYLAFLVFVWAWIIIKALIKFLFENSSIRIGLPIWFGWFPQLICWAFAIAMKNVSKIIEALSLPKELGDLSLSITTSAFVPAICAGVLFFIWLFYKGARKKLKKEIKKAKKEE